MYIREIHQKFNKRRFVEWIDGDLESLGIKLELPHISQDEIEFLGKGHFLDTVKMYFRLQSHE